MSLEPPPKPNWHNPVEIAIICAIVGFVVYSAWVLSAWFDPRIEAVASSAGLILFNFEAVGCSLIVAFLRRAHVQLRVGWFFIALASLSNGIAEFIWFYDESILKIDPFPSLADLFYLLYYPLFLVGVLSFPFIGPKKRNNWVMYADLMIVVVSTAIFFWYFLLSPLELTGSNFIEGVIAISYPAGDLMILAGIVALIQKDSERISYWPLFFISISMIVTTVADIFFAYYETNGLAYRIELLNVLWLASGLSVFLAAAWQSQASLYELPEPAILAHTRSFLRTVLPYLAVILSPVFLYSSLGGYSVFDVRSRGLLHGTILLFGLVLIRQFIILKENAGLYQDMKRIATTDSLTNVYNRHFIGETLEREIKRAKRYGKQLSVLMIDIDNFKYFNDVFGHLQGDKVLKMVARELSRNLRSSDYVARFGGDEFVILLPEANLFAAEVVSKKLQQLVSLLTYENQSLSISVGMAEFRPDISAEQLLEEADKFLYKSKTLKSEKI